MQNYQPLLSPPSKQTPESSALHSSSTAGHHHPSTGFANSPLTHLSASTTASPYPTHSIYSIQQLEYSGLKLKSDLCSSVQNPPKGFP